MVYDAPFGHTRCARTHRTPRYYDNRPTEAPEERNYYAYFADHNEAAAGNKSDIAVVKL